MDRSINYRSLFWPIILIGVGLLWLLVNMGWVPASNAWGLLRLWPILLIAAGLDIIFGRRFPWIGTVIGLATLGFAAVVLLAAPQLNLAGTGGEVETETFIEPVGQAKSANVQLNLPAGQMTISRSQDANYLFKAEVTHYGIVQFSSSGTSDKNIQLRYQSGVSNPFDWFTGQTRLIWKIELTPNLPIALTLNMSSGRADIDLSQIELSSMSLSASSGSADIKLPSTGSVIDVDSRMSSGNIGFVIPEGADIRMTARLSSGNLTIDVPQETALKLDVINKS